MQIQEFDKSKLVFVSSPGKKHLRYGTQDDNQDLILVIPYTMFKPLNFSPDHIPVNEFLFHHFMFKIEACRVLESIDSFIQRHLKNPICYKPIALTKVISPDFTDPSMTHLMKTLIINFSSETLSVIDDYMTIKPHVSIEFMTPEEEWNCRIKPLESYFIDL